MVSYNRGMNTLKKSIRQNVKCSFCGNLLWRVVWNYSQNRLISNFFCNNKCKGEWQRQQRELLGFTKEWLIDQYINKRKDANTIAREIGRDGKRVWEWLKDYKIPTRGRGGTTSPNCFKKGQPNPFKGRKHTLETRKKLSEIAKADGRVPYDPKIGPYQKGKYGPETTNWKGGITPERQSFYSTVEWAEAIKIVWTRDRGICQRCGKNHNTTTNRGKFHIHHIVSFMVKELRADPSNLILVCRKCHLWIHSSKNINKDFLRENADEH